MPPENSPGESSEASPVLTKILPKTSHVQSEKDTLDPSHKTPLKESRDPPVPVPVPVLGSTTLLPREEKLKRQNRENS